MAYALKYNFKWTDTGGANREFEIYEDGFAGTAESIPYSAVEPMSVRMRGDQANTDNIINGQEFTFEIVVSDPANRNKFDPLFESAFQDFYGQYKKNGTVINKGWLKPENLEKDAENPQPRITLAFTDGLADLKDIEFVKSDGSFYTSEMTMLEVIKKALSKIGTTIAARDFRIISNLHEPNLMSVDAGGMTNDANIRVSTIDTRRFIDSGGGKTQADDCYTVIEKILFNFNVKLKVVNDQYWIVDYNESAYADKNFTNGETFVHEVLWSDLTATGHTRTAINNAMNLGGTQYRRGGNLTKLPPLKGYDLRFKNKFLGSVPDATVNDWNNWTVTGDVSHSVDANGVLTVRCDTANDTCMITSPKFDVTQETSEEYLKLIFNYILDNFISNPGGTVNFYPQVLKGFSDSWFTSQTQYFGTRWFQYISPNNPGGAFRVDNNIDPSTYQIRLILNITGDAEVKFQTPDLRKIVPIGTIGGTTVTRDKGFSITQSGGRDVKELESYFGDAEDQFDIGRITIGGTVTSAWSHLQNKQVSISEQILRHKLTNRQSYADIIRFDYLDEDDDISIEKVIKIGSNYYEIIGLDKEYRQGNATVTVRQIFTTIVTYSITDIKLGSADDSTTDQGYGDTGGSSGSGGSGSGGDNPTFQSSEFFLDNNLWMDSADDFNFSNVSTDRTLFSLYNDDLGGTSNFLGSFDYDFTNDAFKINQANLDLDNNNITNINGFGGGGTTINVNDSLTFNQNDLLDVNNFGGGGFDIGIDDNLDFKNASNITNLNTLDFGGTSVNEISTTLDGTSTDDQIPTASTIWSAIQTEKQTLAEVLAEGATADRNIDMGGNNLIGVNQINGVSGILTFEGGIDITSTLTDEHWLRPGNAHQIRIGPASSTARHSVFWYRLASNAQSPNGHAFEVNMDSAETMAITGGSFQLNAGTSVNEIVTTIDGTSTDDQLPTAAAVNTRITGWGLEDARNADNSFDGNVTFTSGNFSLASGTSVNEILSSSFALHVSTDNQLATAKRVYTGIREKNLSFHQNTNTGVVEQDYYKMIETGASDRTVSLPAISGINSGFEYVIKKTDGGAGKVLITPDGTDTIDGQSPYELINQYDSIKIVVPISGTDWRIVSKIT